MKDQTDKVYAWERKWVHWNIDSGSMAIPKDWVKWACKQYRVPPPTVRALKASARDSYYQWPHHIIGLIPSHRNAVTAMHEAAHAICVHFYWDFTHGPRWLGIFLWLLERAGIAPRSALRASAEDAGLDYSTHMTPKTLRHKKRPRFP